MPAQRRCVACQRQIEEADAGRACARCHSDYHRACWDSHGGCIQHDCRPWWLFLQRGWLRCCWLVRWWYDRYWPFSRTSIPWQMWLLIGGLLLFIIFELFGTPMSHLEDLQHYTTR